jgi:hypothetical protein
MTILQKVRRLPLWVRIVLVLGLWLPSGVVWAHIVVALDLPSNASFSGGFIIGVLLYTGFFGLPAIWKKQP